MQEKQKIRVLSLGWKDPLEEQMATHFSILAWKIPWTEEPGRLQSTELQIKLVCLLVEAFNSFTFKVIIDIHIPITILLIVELYSGM